MSSLYVERVWGNSDSPCIELLLLVKPSCINQMHKVSCYCDSALHVTYLVFTSLRLQQVPNHQVSFSLIAFHFDVNMLISCCLMPYLADFFIVRLSPATVFIIVMQSIV